MKRKERKRMRNLMDKYYDRMGAVNNLYDEFIKEADKFRMNCVQQIGKLMDKDKELKKLLEESQKVYKKNRDEKK